MIQNQAMTARKIASYFIIIAFVVALLIIGKRFLIPLFVAIVIWYLINAINTFIQGNAALKKLIPNWLGLTLSGIVLIGFLVGVGELISENVNAMVNAAPDYRSKLALQFQGLVDMIGITTFPDFEMLVTELNLDQYLTRLLNSVRNTATNFFLILIYVIF
ncbi:MAG: hypothetical protein AAFO94_16365, partial [Bacteroidota bacterium]